jgi:multicomponent Na+:H+ antiporter subunit E
MIMLHALGCFVFLYGFWVLLSGYFTAFLLVAGAGSAVAALLLAHRMHILDREGQPIHLAIPAVFTYWPWLIKEIILSGWNVTWRILHPQLPITPTMARFAPTQKTDVGLVIHANSITLTPGTIAVEVGRGEILVHALTAEGAAQLAGSEMDRRVTQLELRR